MTCYLVGIKLVLKIVKLKVDLPVVVVAGMELMDFAHRHHDSNNIYI